MFWLSDTKYFGLTAVEDPQRNDAGNSEGQGRPLAAFRCGHIPAAARCGAPGVRACLAKYPSMPESSWSLATTAMGKSEVSCAALYYDREG